jgi:hypothetical protein
VIGKVTRGSDVGGLLRYLYGPGKANEHTNPHLVASWNGDDRATLGRLEPVPGRGRHRFAPLADRLALPLQLLPDVPDKYVWQCSMRLADGDRRLSDAEWAQVAREVVEGTGFAPVNDPGGCRWVAVRHADDHIHVVVVLARQDGQPVNTFRDWPKVRAAARTVERRFGLTTVPSPDRSATVAASRAEVEKAARRGHREPARAWLTREVRFAAAGSTSRETFEWILAQQEEIVVSWRYSTRTPGQITGYRVGRLSDVDASGKQIWFAGSKLSPDLSLPKLEARWREAAGSPGRRSPRLRATERRAVLDRAGSALNRASREGLHPGTLVSAGEVATTLARGVESENGGPLTLAADQLSRAARRPRGERPPMGFTVHDLRTVAADLASLGRIVPGEAGQVLLIVADLARIAAALARSHSSVEGDPRGRAARRALRQYTRFTGAPTAAQVQQVRSALSEHHTADVLADPAWPALAAQMRRLESGGVDPSRALDAAFRSREVGSAQSLAQVLHYRLAHGVLPPGPVTVIPAHPISPQPQKAFPVDRSRSG